MMMASDQHFCLRWNNHQNTLVSVFEHLLVNERLIDVTLTAEGQMIGAHKVVLSACSPYFEEIFTRCGDKHPVIFLKDIRFSELKALLDYMYKGEVNVSQDQLNILIKAAESLNIKGLADRKDDESEQRNLSPKLLEQNNGDAGESYRSSHSFDMKDSNTPWPIKRRKKARNRSGESRPSSEPDSDSHDHGGTCASETRTPSVVIPNIPATITAVHPAPKSSDSHQEDKDSGNKTDNMTVAPAPKEEMSIKEECLDILEMSGEHEDTEDTDVNRSCDQKEAGPSGQLDSQGFSRFSEVNTSLEDKFDSTESSQVQWGEWDHESQGDPISYMYPAVHILTEGENHNDEDTGTRPFTCPRCFRGYKKARYLRRHVMEECGVERKHSCSICGSKFAHSHHLRRHVKNVHRNIVDQELKQETTDSKSTI